MPENHIMTPIEARRLGIAAYDNGGPAAPALCAEIMQQLAGLPVGHPRTYALMLAYSRGYQYRADEAARAVLAAS